jgi:nucleotide-binding universal stress UspA family protein
MVHRRNLLYNREHALRECVMAFKDILVFVDDGKSCHERLAVAARLAVAHSAHLIGLHVRSVPQLPGFIIAEYGGAISALQAKLNSEAAERAKAAFEEAVAGLALSVEWRDVTGNALDVLPLHARYADLAVVGQADPDDSGLAAERHLVDNLVLEAGRPVLVVPFVGHYPTLGRRTLIAWNASREATRSVADALPVLRRADWVRVLAINPTGGNAAHGEIPGADIGLHLARHGVTAICDSIRAEDLDAGSLLLSRAADLDADLLVMGAYGRSRMRELVLGGATLHILRHLTIPVLLSH